MSDFRIWCDFVLLYSAICICLLVGSFTQNAFFIPLRYFSIVFQSKCATDVFEFECCALVFKTASPRIIHHSKTLHWKKTKKTSSTDLSRDQNTICVWTQYSNSCSSSAGRLVYGPTNTWMGHICFYLFIYFYFALRHRPLSLPQPPPHQCCAGAGPALKLLLLLLLLRVTHSKQMTGTLTL